jgi:hypothetical protein
MMAEKVGTDMNGTKLSLFIAYVLAPEGDVRTTAQGVSPGNGLHNELQPAKRATDDFLSPPGGLFY